MASLAAFWAGLRNRLIGDARFQTFAERFFATRGLARARAGALFDLAVGFVYSQTLAACCALDLFTRLARGPFELAALAQECRLAPLAMERLLRAAAALDLTQRVREGWMLGAQGAALCANPGIAAMVAHHARLYADLADPVEALRRGPGGGALARYWAYDGSGDSCAYSALMAASQPMVARQALAAYPFRRRRALLDVGGGDGSFLIAVAAQAPKLSLMLFDLPDVVDLARARFYKAGLPVLTRAGEAPRDSLPAGADTISFVRVLHDHDDEIAAALLARAHEALPAGGHALIVEPLADTRGARAMGDCYFGLYLWAMGQGRPRTFAEYSRMLREAGFSRVRERRTVSPLLARVLIGERGA